MIKSQLEKYKSSNKDERHNFIMYRLWIYVAVGFIGFSLAYFLDLLVLGKTIVVLSILSGFVLMMIGFINMFSR